MKGLYKGREIDTTPSLLDLCMTKDFMGCASLLVIIMYCIVVYPTTRLYGRILDSLGSYDIVLLHCSWLAILLFKSNYSLDFQENTRRYLP